MKKHLPFAILAAVLAVMLVSAGLGRYRTFVAEDTHRILLTDGTTGKQVEITEEAAVRAIAEDVTSLRFERMGKEDSSTWCYNLQFFSKNGTKLASLSILEENGHVVSFGGQRYRVAADHCVDTDLFLPFLSTHTGDFEPLSGLLTGGGHG